MNYPDSVRFLYQLGNEIKTAKYDLARMEALLAAMGNPQRRPGRFLHIAGTNGKGSICAMLEAGLRAAGLRTGLYTSPHLAEPTERIRINGDPVSAGRFLEAFQHVHQVSEELIASGAIEHHPTYFETITAMAFWEFRQQAVDIAVIEVGLGGRLDATNVVEPELCLISPVDFDHEAILGKSIEAIAGEKAGILKPGVPVVISRQREEVEIVIRARAAETGSAVIPAPLWRVSNLVEAPHGSRFRLTGPVEIEVACPLAGQHQVENATTAFAALWELGLPPRSIVQGIAAARWPGRLEHRGRFVLDGAHNPAGARALAAYVRRFYGHSEKTLIFGAMRDKAVDEMVGLLFPLFDRVVVTAPDQPRALDPETFREVSDHPGIQSTSRLPDALKLVAHLPGPVFVAGSLFLVAEAREILASS